MTILIGLSSLPFLHELILDNDGNPFSWVPNFHIAETLTTENGRVWGYSKYHVLMYFLLIQLYTLIAWIGWFTVAKNKKYRLAILMGVASSAYHLILIVFNSRKTNFNNADIKLISTAIIGILLFLIYYYYAKKREEKLQHALDHFGHAKNKLISVKLLLSWAVIFCISTGPYLHDIITVSGKGVTDWVPQLGMVEFLTDTSSGKVWGFNSYRIFLLTISLHVFAQIAWAGWLHDAIYKLYRPFLLVPVGLSLYQIIVMLLDKTDAYLNRPNIKLLMILFLGSIICYFYFFKNKRFESKIIDASEVSQTAQSD